MFALIPQLLLQISRAVSFKKVNSTPEFREIAHLSADYRATLELRDRLLRAPLGLTFTEADLANECADIHIGAFNSERNLIACLVLSPESPVNMLRMRQVAVDSELQRHGIGSQLVSYAESVALRRGITTMTLHARRDVSAFYQKLGYAEVGGPFTEVGILHIAMQKGL